MSQLNKYAMGINPTKVLAGRWYKRYRYGMTAQTCTLAVSHRDIIDRAGGPAAIARIVTKFEWDAGRPSVDANTTKKWKRNDSIPGVYWQAFAECELASLEELAAAAAAKRAA